MLDERANWSSGPRRRGRASRLAAAVGTLAALVVVGGLPPGPRIAEAADLCPPCAEAEALAKKLQVHPSTKSDGDAPVTTTASAEERQRRIRLSFTRLRKLFADKTASCPRVEKNAAPGCDAAPTSARCVACRELDRVRRALVEGTFGYLSRLNAHGFKKGDVLDDAVDAINAAFVVDPKNREQLARLVADIVASGPIDDTDPEALVGAMQMATNPTVMKHLRDRIEASGAAVPELLKNATGKEGGSPRAFVDAYLNLDRAWKARVTRWLDEADPSYQHKLYEHIRSAKAVRIVVKHPAHGSAAAEVAERELVNSFVLALTSRTAEGPYAPTYATDAEWEARRNEAEALCKKEDCDVLLALSAEVVDAATDFARGAPVAGTVAVGALPELRMSAALTFVGEEKPRTAENEAPLDVVVPLAGRRPDDQILVSDAFDAANALMNKLGARMEILGQAHAMAHQHDIKIQRPVREGVSVYREPACLPAKRQQEIRGAGVKIDGSCGPAFDGRFKAVAQALSDPIGPLIQPGTDDRRALTLSLAQNARAGGSCSGTLTRGAEKTFVYKFVTVVDQDSLAKSGDAGADAASRLAEIYSGASCETSSPATASDVAPSHVMVDAPVEHGRPPPAAPPPPGPFHRAQALVLAGLPWLTDGRDTSGDGRALAASIADASLLAVGIGSVAYSAWLRDQYALGKTDSLGRADAFRVVGLALGGAVLLGRVVGFLLYRTEPGVETTSARRSRPRESRVSAGPGALRIRF